jgi:hypothetical protein
MKKDPITDFFEEVAAWLLGTVLGLLLLVLVLVMVTRPARGADLSLAWDHDDPGTNTTFVLFGSTNAGAAWPVRLDLGTNRVAELEDLLPGQWSFCVAALARGVESDKSPVVGIDVPRAPRDLKAVVVQFSGSLTNSRDVGFFRLRLP